MQHTTNLHQPTRSSILRQSYIRTIYFKQQEHIHITPVNNMTEHKQEAVTTETVCIIIKLQYNNVLTITANTTRTIVLFYISYTINRIQL